MRYIIENKTYQFYIGRAKSLMRTPHIHTHLEMIYLTEGSTTVLLDGREYAMEQGDLFVAFPNQIHGYEPRSSVELVLIIFSADMDAGLAKLLKDKVPVFPVIKAKDLPSDTAQRLETILEKNRQEHPWDQLSAKGLLIGFLGEALSRLPLTARDSDNDSVKSILAYCAENFTKPITLDSVAKELHLSKYYVSHIVTERMGVSFTKFVNSLRVDRACTLLAGGTDITEVCYASGFSSIRTFNRVFLQGMGVSPRQYRKK